MMNAYLEKSPVIQRLLCFVVAVLKHFQTLRQQLCRMLLQSFHVVFNRLSSVGIGQLHERLDSLSIGGRLCLQVGKIILGIPGRIRGMAQ